MVRQYSLEIISGEVSMLSLKNIFFIPLAISLLILVIPVHGYSANIISGKYISSSGSQIVLQLNIQSSTPLNIIVEQYISAANTITSTSPAAKKVGGGKIKWLFRKTQNSTLNLTIQLAKPLSGTVAGVINYRSPQNGKLIKLAIHP